MPIYPDFRSGVQAVSGKEEYYVSDEDKATTTKYYGLVAKNKSWVIIKNDTTAGSYRYVTGKYAYTTNWTNRADLTYKYFYELP